MTFKVLLSPPDVGELEREYVLRAMESGWVAPAGPDLDAFEAEIAERVGISYAVALASGTAGLHLALVSWGVGPGDVVPVSTFTFAATVNAIRYVGAEPWFIDCDPLTGNMDPGLLEKGLAQLAAADRRVPVVVVVDMFGKCADFTAIADVLAGYQGIRLLSDAAESFGASHRGIPAGKHGDAAVVSFNGNKILTTSGGGMLLTDDADMAARVRKLSTQAREPVTHYEHAEIGYNYRLSNLLAALGRAQLRRLDEMIAKRRHWRECYRELFAPVPGACILGADDDSEDNCWLTAVVVDPAVAGWRSECLGARLRDNGIEIRPVWKPMHLQPVFDQFQGTLGSAAELLFERGLTLPSSSAMSEEQFVLVRNVIRDVLESA